MDDHSLLELLESTPPWEWPEAASGTIVRVLSNSDGPEADRLLAADLAASKADTVGELIDALLCVAGDQAEPAKLRARCAIALGPFLEIAEDEGLVDEDELCACRNTAGAVQDALRRLHGEPSAPKELRRRALEASVRASQDWHGEAIRSAYSSDDPEWKVTAVFCMRYVPGFHEQVLESLRSSDREVLYEAVCASGDQGVDAAWPVVAALVRSPGIEKQLLLAAIEAASNLRPTEATDLLDDLMDSDDPDVEQAVDEALAADPDLSDEDGDLEGEEPDSDDDEDEDGR